jgi:predicted DsbA family dithiol-disulfide isomerase
MKGNIFEYIEKIKGYLITQARKNSVFITILVLLSVGFMYSRHRVAKMIEEKEIEETALEGTVFVDTALYNKTIKEKKEYLLNNFDNDFVIGDEKAPLTLVDFSSFSCMFCRKMRDDMDKIIDEYAVKSKQLRYVLRPVVNSKTIPLKILLNCVDDDEKRWKLINNMFSVNWDGAPSVKTVVDGLVFKHKIDMKEIRKCLTSDDEYRKIVYYQKENSLIFKIQKTPLLVINGKKYFGYRDYDGLKKIIEENVQKN